jgi:hypothetical protein
MLGVEVPEATALLGVGSDEVATVTPPPSVALPIVKPEGEGGGGAGQGGR